MSRAVLALLVLATTVPGGVLPGCSLPSPALPPADGGSEGSADDANDAPADAPEDGPARDAGPDAPEAEADIGADQDAVAPDVLRDAGGDVLRDAPGDVLGDVPPDVPPSCTSVGDCGTGLACCLSTGECVGQADPCDDGRIECEVSEDCPSGGDCCGDRDTRSTVCDFEGACPSSFRSTCRVVSDCGGSGVIACCPVAGAPFSICSGVACPAVGDGGTD